MTVRTHSYDWATAPSSPAAASAAFASVRVCVSCVGPLQVCCSSSTSSTSSSGGSIGAMGEGLFVQSAWATYSQGLQPHGGPSLLAHLWNKQQRGGSGVVRGDEDDR